jgi:hypothetical protein
VFSLQRIRVHCNASATRNPSLEPQTEHHLVWTRRPGFPANLFGANQQCGPSPWVRDGGQTLLSLRRACGPLPLCGPPIPLQTLPRETLRGPYLRCRQGRFLRARRAFLGRHVPRGRFAALPAEHARDLGLGCSNVCRDLHAFDGTSDSVWHRSINQEELLLEARIA